MTRLSTEPGWLAPSSLTREVTVVAVTWNSEELLPTLLASLGPGMDGVASWELVVADNASRDDTVGTVARLAPHATVVQAGANRGYAAGINLALDHAPPSRAYLLCNPDVRLAPGATGHLLAALSEPGTGVTVPRLRRPDGGLLRSLRREPSLSRVFGEALLGGDRAGRLRLLGEVVGAEDAYARPWEPTWASGAAMLVSRDCLRRVGRWDESFFLYGEETDFALRARDAGLSIRYCPEAEAVHIGGEAHTSPELYGLLMRNRAELYARRHGAAASALFRGGLVLGEALRAARGSAGGSALHRAALRSLLHGRSGGVGAGAAGVDPFPDSAGGRGDTPLPEGVRDGR